MTQTEGLIKPNRARFSLGEIVDATGGTVDFDRTLLSEGVITDTRADLNGALFVALRGARFDGHTFLQQAREQGAVAAVVAHDYHEEAPADFPLIKVEDTTRALGDIARAHRRKFSIPVIGVTGSYGKTTTRALIVAALGVDVLSSAANNNNEIGVPQTLLQLDETHAFAVVEMGMRGAGQIAELARIAEPTVGVITNVGPQHIEFFDDFSGVVAAKAELLRGLSKDGIAIIPDSDEYGRILASHAQSRVVTFGVSQNADYRIEDIHTVARGITFTLYSPQGRAENISVPLIGAHNALNAAAALAVACESGIDLQAAARGFENVDVPGARMVELRVGDVTILNDSYNAGPDSMQAALETLKTVKTARRVAVLGAMKELGRWSEDEHRKLGEAARFADAIFWVGEETSVAHAVAGGQWFASAAEAAPVVTKAVRAQDYVLVKGSRSVGLEKVVDALAGGVSP